MEVQVKRNHEETHKPESSPRTPFCLVQRTGCLLVTPTAVSEGGHLKGQAI